MQGKGNTTEHTTAHLRAWQTISNYLNDLLQEVALPREVIEAQLQLDVSTPHMLSLTMDAANDILALQAENEKLKAENEHFGQYAAGSNAEEKAIQQSEIAKLENENELLREYAALILGFGERFVDELEIDERTLWRDAEAELLGRPETSPLAGYFEQFNQSEASDND